MSNPAPTQNSAAMIRTLTLIATLSGLLVVGVVELTRDSIAANQREAVERAIFRVLPGAVSWREYRLQGEQLFTTQQTPEGVALYAGFDGEQRLVGIAAEGAAQGYADTIRLLYGYSPACECITGIQILKSAETPGLGDKIFKDAAFVANFDALDARLDEAGAALRNAIVTVKHGQKREAWQIDAISGATVSSRAVGKALNDSTQYLLPRLLPQLAQIGKGESAHE